MGGPAAVAPAVATPAMSPVIDIPALSDFGGPKVDGKRFTKVAGRLILALEAAISTVPLKPLFSGVDGSTFGSFKTPWPTSPSHL